LEDMQNAGIKDIAIILGSVWPEKVREYYGDGSSLDLHLHYIPQGEPKGLAHAVGLAKEFVGKDKFVVYLGDNLLKGGIADHADTFASSSADAMVLLSNIERFLYLDRFGVAKFDGDGKLEALIEKPKEPPSPYALVGVYFFTPLIFDSISKLAPSRRGEFEITDAIQSLLRARRNVEHRFIEGWWKDTGTPEDILEANRLILDEKLRSSEIQGHVEDEAVVQGRVRIDAGARISKGSTIRGPAYIGKETTIEPGTYVGPYTSIGNRCKISSCEIENSIVMDECQIRASQRITDSIIGTGTEISAHENNLPKAYRLVLGERSQMQL
jgi:glucose-1-phosphate thymidylyltransferase